MISSMTGFARAQTEAEWGSLIWELRSVNHRYLEASFRLPEAFRFLEMKWKQLLMKRVSRGKVDIFLKFQPASGRADDIALNDRLVNELSRFSSILASSFPNAQTQIMDVLNWPGVIETKETDINVIAEAATKAFNEGLDHLVVVRQEEGQSLLNFFEKRLALMQGYIAEVESLIPSLLETTRSKIKSRFDELSLDLDKDRFEQEMVWIAQKLDVAEEMKRLKVHVNEFAQVVTKGGVVGRRLDFLSQELNREANTLASKSIDATVTHLAVELKVLIEQIREQVQNIE